MKLDLNRIYDILFRAIRSYRARTFPILYKNIQNYISTNNFKKVMNRKISIQEYPGLYDIFKRSGFDMSLADSVRDSIPDIHNTYIKQIDKFKRCCLSPLKDLGIAGVHQRHLDFITYRFYIDISYSNLRFIAPSKEEILSSQNLRASQGFPDPSVRKRDLLTVFSDILDLFYSRALRPEDILIYPSVIFTRTQIRKSGLKVRLVHAVQAFQQLIESYYFMYAYSGLKDNSTIILGRTQLELSDIVKGNIGYYTYSVDYSSWDLLKQPVFSVISFDILSQILPLSEYELKVFKYCRNSYLTLPSYSPLLEFDRRFIGTVSGSGFTSLDNSISNWVVVTILIYNYCIRKGLDPYKFNYNVKVSGDDLIINSKIKIQIENIFQNAKDQFGLEMRLECDPSYPNSDRCVFLGSLWRYGCPFRDESLMVSSVLFGSGNFPKMDTITLFQSRFFEVFGNSCDTYYYWKRLNMTPIRRLFFFSELFSPYRSGSPYSKRNQDIIELLRKNESSTRRGFWRTTAYDQRIISSLWMMR